MAIKFCFCGRSLLLGCIKEGYKEGTLWIAARLQGGALQCIEIGNEARNAAVKPQKYTPLLSL